MTVMEIFDNLTPYELAMDPKYANIWRITFNPKVCPEKNKVLIHVNKRSTATATTSEKYSSKHYATLEERNAAIFDGVWIMNLKLLQYI